MKTFHLFFIIGFMFSGVISIFGQDLKEYHLKGKVKSFRQTDYEIVNKFGDLQKGKILVDPADNSAPQYDRLISFDMNGKEIENSDYNLFDNNNLRKRTSKRDSKGNIIEEIQYYKGKLYSTIKFNYKYNEKGQIIEKITYNSDGTIIPLKFKYDEEGNWVGYNQNGSINSKEIIKNGKKIEEIHYDSDGKIELHRKYDENGRIIESSEPYQSNYYNNHYLWKYDNNGNEIEEIWKTDGYDWKKITKYDVNGNIIEKQCLDRIENTTTIYTFTVDTHGNWIKSISTKNGKPSEWTERKIVYYP